MSATPMSVEVTSTLDVPAIMRRLFPAELKVLRTHAGQIVREIKAKWTGWKYVGRSLASVGRSRAAWRSKVQSTEHPFSFTIENEARSYYGNKPYASFVARSKGAEPEHVKVYKWLVFERMAQVERDLTDAILTSIAEGAKGPPKRLNTSTPGPRRSSTFT